MKHRHPVRRCTCISGNKEREEKQNNTQRDGPRSNLPEKHGGNVKLFLQLSCCNKSRTRLALWPLPSRPGLGSNRSGAGVSAQWRATLCSLGKSKRPAPIAARAALCIICNRSIFNYFQFLLFFFTRGVSKDQGEPGSEEGIKFQLFETVTAAATTMADHFGLPTSPPPFAFEAIQGQL